MGCRVCPSSVGPSLPLSAWVPYVQPYVYDAPQEAVIHAIRLTMIDFCNETGVLSRDMLVDAMANVADYPLDVDPGYMIRGLTRVADQNDRALPLLQQQPVYNSGAHGARLDGLGALLIYPAPREDCERRWRVTVVIAPTPLTQQVDRELLDAHAEAIGYGATARVKMMPGGDWTDTRGAPGFMRQYQQKRADAKARKQRNHQRGVVTMTAPRWA